MKDSLIELPMFVKNIENIFGNNGFETKQELGPNETFLFLIKICYSKIILGLCLTLLMTFAMSKSVKKAC